jgi:hypothetical protein
MARAICPSRCLVNRSVLRRSWPKFENQELVHGAQDICANNALFPQTTRVCVAVVDP